MMTRVEFNCTAATQGSHHAVHVKEVHIEDGQILTKFVTGMEEFRVHENLIQSLQRFI